MQLNAIHTTLPKLTAVIYVYRSSCASAKVLLYASGLPGLFGSLDPEDIAQLHTGFM
jgi:hypothetical protein